MAGVRFLVAGAILYAWARWRGASAPTVRNWRASAVVGGFLLLLFVAEHWVDYVHGPTATIHKVNRDNFRRTRKIF